MLKWIRVILLVWVMQGLVSGHVVAASFEGLDFPETASVKNGTRVLNGLGPRFATIAKIRVYVAGLYVPVKTTVADELISSQGPKQLFMKFQRDVSAEQFRDAWEKGLEKASKH